MINRDEQARARVGAVELGAFRLTRLLGSGSFATAYLAEHTGNGSATVVKVAHPDLFAGSRAAELRMRFAAEARAASRVRHPCLPRIYASGETMDGVPAIAMEYIAGPSLGTVLTRRDMVDLAFIDRCFTGLGHTLKTIHDVGIVHRDVTPKNVVWSPGPSGEYRPVLLDFGVARLDNRSMGTVGAMGTPGYMPPEQLFGRAIPRSDMYALGAIFWWACTGRSFLSYFDDVEDLLSYQMGDRDPPDPLAVNPAVPPDVADLLVWMLDPDASARPSPEEFIDTWHAIHPTLVGRWEPPRAPDPEERANTEDDGPIDLQLATANAGPHYNRVPEVSVTADDPGLLRLITAYLRGAGHVVEVSMAPSATRSDGRTPPRVFVLESGLPGLDVGDVCEELKAENPEAIVLIVSGPRSGPAAVPNADGAFDLPADLPALTERIRDLMKPAAHDPSTWLPLPLNRDTIARLGEDADPARVAARIDEFLGICPRWMVELSELTARGHWDATRRICSALSQHASFLGADRLSDLAQVVHSLAGHDAILTQRTVGDLGGELERVSSALKLTRAQFLRSSAH